MECAPASDGRLLIDRIAQRMRRIRDVTRRPPFRTARVAAVAMLTAGWAFALAMGPASAATDPSAAAGDNESQSGTTEDAAPDLVTFGLSSATDGRLDGRPYLEMTATPGSTIYEQVAVLNQSDKLLSLDLYAADAINTANGSVGLPSRDVTPTDAGSWITLGAPRVGVPPQSSSGIGFTIVPITITVPADAEPGDHLAGVLTSLTARGSASGDGRTAQLDLEQRVGLRVYVTVDGPLHPGLTVTDVHATYHRADYLGLAPPGSATVTYTLTNTGNTRLNVLATSTASGVFGPGEATAVGPQVAELLPKSSVTQTVEMAGVWPTILQKVTVSASATAPLAGTDPNIGTPSASVWMWAVPWPFLVLLVLVALAWRLLRQRAKTAKRGRHSDSGSSVTPNAGDIGPEQSSTKEAVSSHLPSAS